MLLTTPILSTKLFIPPATYRLTSRARVVELLTQGNKYKLSLICAPAGFGKTTLVMDWHQAYPQETLAWISLDENDNEPGRFLRYLSAAFRDFIPDVSETLLSQLDQPQPVEIENILTTLINSLTEYTARLELNHIFLVLDDYHVIVNDVIHKAITLMLEYMPPQLHLIITSRFDPPLPLHRWRARNQLLEIRAADLRFKVEETATFIAQDDSLARELFPDDILLLTNRTEGWAVGLQLALLWLKGRDNKASALQDFSGSNRFVLEYLGGEVLLRQPEAVRTFLLKTSILDRFNLKLANEVTGLDWNEEELTRLEQTNLFLIPLDEKGEWYRFHHLFAEFLQHRLKREWANHLAELHQRASRWFEQNGLINEAIKHGLAGADYHRTCTLIEEVAWTIIQKFEILVFEDWLVKIPEEILLAHPYLCVQACLYCLITTQVSKVDKLVSAVEKGIKLLDTPFKLLSYYSFRMELARIMNNLAAIREYSELALAVSPHQTGSIFLAQSALASLYVNQGEVNKIVPYLDILITRLRNKQNFVGQITTGSVVGNFYLLQGQLDLAAEIFQEIINITGENSLLSPICYLRLGNIYLEWNNLAQAQIYFDKAEELITQPGKFKSPVGYYFYSGLWWPAGDELPTIKWSDATLVEIERYWNDSYQAQIEAFKTRLTNKPTSRLGELEKWSETRFPGGYQALVRPLEYQLEPQYLTLARVLIQQNKIREARSLLEELQLLAQLQGQTHNLIKILILSALANYFNQQDNHRLELALLALREALTLAEPGHYVRVFLEEGPIIEGLLQLLLPRLESEGSTLLPYSIKLLLAFEPQKESEVEPNPDPNLLTVPFDKPTGLQANPGLLEPLSGRELEVLVLVASGASNREIGEKMVITLPTVKKHLSNIFSKLGVTSRTQLLVRAKELSLI